MRYLQFKEPIQQQINAEFALHVIDVRIDDRNAITATIEAHNGKLLDSDVIKLSVASARNKYAKRVGRKAGVEQDAIDQALIELNAGLPAAYAMAEAQEAETSDDANNEQATADPQELYQECKHLLNDPRLLDLVYETMQHLGLVGEEKNAKLLYLVVTSRFLDRIVSAIVKGPSSAGKSFIIRVVLQMFPKTAFEDFSSISPKFLAYASIELAHKFIVIFEAAGLADGFGAYMMRSLLSEGCIKVGTVEKQSDGDNSEQVARLIEKPGPSGLISTTCGEIDEELGTRALDCVSTDTPAHSRAILRGTAQTYDIEDKPQVDLAPWLALQEWLATAGEHRVVIPFAKALAELVPTVAVRIRRDFSKLLSLIAAHAILFQCQRERVASGAILATLEDYAAVRELLNESFSSAQREGLTDAQREAIQAVIDLVDELKRDAVGVTLAEVANKLKIDKSAASRRLANALKAGFVRDLHDDGQQRKRGRRAAYVPGDPMPPREDALPTVDLLNEQPAADVEVIEL